MVLFSVAMIYWILIWWNFALWAPLIAYDMPYEAMLFKYIGNDMVWVGVAWLWLFWSLWVLNLIL